MFQIFTNCYAALLHCVSLPFPVVRIFGTRTAQHTTNESTVDGVQGKERYDETDEVSKMIPVRRLTAVSCHGINATKYTQIVSARNKHPLRVSCPTITVNASDEYDSATSISDSQTALSSRSTPVTPINTRFGVLRVRAKYDGKQKTVSPFHNDS
ncbi:hypothetical protein AB6A40_009364 [Gnathostoma spinigerum]|uniref:Uncharacterized protein n=1 Tax=Gnathostoma spinigerum TaxID=75299 RepID=A0ABD6ERR9_9BILA